MDVFAFGEREICCQNSAEQIPFSIKVLSEYLKYLGFCIYQIVLLCQFTVEIIALLTAAKTWSVNWMMEDNIKTSTEGERKKSAQVYHLRRRIDAEICIRSKRAADNKPEEIDVNVSFSNLCRKRQRKQTFKTIYLDYPYLKINLVHPSLKSGDFWFTLYFMANFTSI